MRAILQPCSNRDAQRHYDDTVRNPVDLAAYAPLTSSIASELGSLYPEGKAPIWGVTPGGANISKWSKVERGDKAFFSAKGAIFATSTLTLKFHSPEMARQLWGTDPQGQTWEYIYFLDEVDSTHIPYADFNRIVGYAENNVIMGFTVLDEEKSAALIEAYELTSKRYSPPVTRQQFEQAVGFLVGKEELDKPSGGTSRVEQAYLRNSLLPNKHHHCAICGELLPKEFLVAAHVQKRSLCTLEERKDVANVVMPACKFGCDELFERGFITINHDGEILPRRIGESPFIDSYLKKLVGRRCSALTATSSKYFTWHRDFWSAGQ